MKTTKQQLRQIIKEELEVILTNEEAGELFGEGVEAELEEQELNEDDPAMIASMLDPETIEALKLIAQVGVKIGKETLTPVALGLLGVAGARRGMGNRDKDKQSLEDAEKEFPMAPARPPMMEQEKVAGDVARVGKKLGGVQGLEALLASIDNREKFEAVMTQFIQMVAKDRLKPSDVKMGVRNVAAQVLKVK